MSVFIDDARFVWMQSVPVPPSVPVVKGVRTSVSTAALVWGCFCVFIMLSCLFFLHQEHTVSVTA